MLKVSDNKRFLSNDDETPFFYVGDTAWSLFNALDRDDVAYYLKDRAVVDPD
jgi:phosphatidate phosphatase APP1